MKQLARLQHKAFLYPYFTLMFNYGIFLIVVKLLVKVK